MHIQPKNIIIKTSTAGLGLGATEISTVVAAIKKSAEVLNDITRWAVSCGLSLNASKIELVLFTRNNTELQKLCRL